MPFCKKLPLVWTGILIALWLFWGQMAIASPLLERLEQFPNWQNKPSVQFAKGDLIYPDWFDGTWTVTTTLVDLASPLAPEIVTPGFESNRQYLNQPIPFQVRFIQEPSKRRDEVALPFMQSRGEGRIISDRAFNGLNLAKAYLEDFSKPQRPTVLAVKIDPNNSNRQITLLRNNRQLVSTVTGRAVDPSTADQFVTTEIFQQEFRGALQLYFNEVETISAYQKQLSENPAIAADQVTAIYLSPQDPDYFKAGDRPVALYRYRLEFFPHS